MWELWIEIFSMTANVRMRREMIRGTLANAYCHHRLFIDWKVPIIKARDAVEASAHRIQQKGKANHQHHRNEVRSRWVFGYLEIDGYCFGDLFPFRQTFLRHHLLIGRIDRILVLYSI